MVRQHSLCETGPYLTPTISSSFDPGNLNLSFRGSLQRPDCIGNGKVANAVTGNMFNIAAFNPIPEGPAGNRGVESWRAWHRYDRGWVVQNFPSHGTDADAP